MGNVLTIVKLVGACIPFVATCMVANKMNFSKEERYKQVFLPLIALIYCVVAVIFLNRISDGVLKAIYWLIGKFRILSFLNKINWAYYSVIVVNTALVTGFIAVKGTMFPALMGLSLIPNLAEYAGGWFYYVREEDVEKDGKKEKKNVHYLMSKYGDAKKILAAIYYTMLGVFVALLVATYFMTSVKLFSAPFYPAFGILVLGEVLAFLSGQTEEEKKAGEDGGEAPEEQKKEDEDYDKLPEKYEEAFGARLIRASHLPATECAAESAGALLDKYRREYEKDFNQEAGLIYTYYSGFDPKKKVLDEGYLRQTRNILDGKSVLFFTQFYNDTTDYVFLPVVRNLMKCKRILVVLGSSVCSENIRNWFYGGISSINGFERIWKVEEISDADDTTSVMILSAKHVYDQKMLNEKATLLAQVSMVFIIEANQLLGTLQIGMSCLVSFLRAGGNDPQYIVYDRNCDGLVDSLSHVLNKSLVQVNATSAGTAKRELLFWKADGKMLHHRLGLQSSRYLGMGTELALLALKEKVSEVTWASSDNFPVTDMGWIAFQYYAGLCKAAGLNVSQNELAEHLIFSADPLSLARKKHSFMVVEDEYNNAFEAARQFATRGEKQSFVNVISPNYWLREYMTDNPGIFQQDPKSIPTITADYQRSSANTVYKLIIRMIEGPVAEEEIRDALDLLGEDTENIYKSLRRLILRYFFRVENEEKADAQTRGGVDQAISMTSHLATNPRTYRAETKRFYSINSGALVDKFMSQLKIVYYLAEDEKDRNKFLGSAMYGHVCQKYLPGMLITLEGKYYEVISMTKNNGVLVRRASDHINQRKYYRTLRQYQLTCHTGGEARMGAVRTLGGITVEHLEADIVVNTFGYLELTEYSNVKNAKRIGLSNIDPREYRNKECIRIRMEGSTAQVRTTVAVLLNELFVTVFPDTHQYITAVTACEQKDGILGLMPELTGIEDDGIYIIEDSLIDLGLLINADRYFVRFLEIICDVLNWHREKLAEEAAEGGEDDGPQDEGPDEPDEPEEEKPKGIFGWIKRLLRRKKKKKDDGGGETGTEEEAPESSVSAPVLRSSAPERPEVHRSDEPDDSGITGDDSGSITVTDGMPEIKDEKLPYSQSFFLLYGYEAVPSVLDTEATEKYLTEQGFAENYLKQTRTNGKFGQLKWYNYRFEAGTHYCDFCGKALKGTFDVLDDGRERCPECSAEAITKVKDLKRLYKKTRKEMEAVFGIRLKAKISIRMCNAEKIAEEVGEKFTPSPEYDGRVLGFAYRYGGSHDIYIENGAPAMETAKTLVHEMTHIWQYAHLPDLFTGTQDKLPIEGMAVWAEAQYMISVGQKERAEDYVRSRLMQTNEYGLGLKKYLEKFPLRDKEKVHQKTPFNCTRNPLN